jgi:hypothetical protein
MSNFTDYQTFIKDIGTKYLNQPTNVLFNDEEVSFLYYLMFSRASFFKPELKFPTPQMVKEPITYFFKHGKQLWYNAFDEMTEEDYKKDLEKRKTERNIADFDLTGTYKHAYRKYMLRRISANKSKDKSFISVYEIINKLLEKLIEYVNALLIKDKEGQIAMEKREDWISDLEEALEFSEYIAMDLLLKNIHDRYKLPWQLTKYTIPSKIKEYVEMFLPIVKYEKPDKKIISKNIKIHTVIKNLTNWYNVKSNKENTERINFEKKFKKHFIYRSTYLKENYNQFIKPMYFKILEFLKTGKIEPMFLKGLTQVEQEQQIATPKTITPVATSSTAPYTPEKKPSPKKPEIPPRTKKPEIPPRTKKPSPKKPIEKPKITLKPKIPKKPEIPPRTKKPEIPPRTKKPEIPPRTKKPSPKKPVPEKPEIPPRTKKPVMPDYYSEECAPVLKEYIKVLTAFMATYEP